MKPDQIGDGAFTPGADRSVVHPLTDRSCAPGVVDGADGHVLRCAQVAAHEVTSGGEILDGIRRGQLPLRRLCEMRLRVIGNLLRTLKSRRPESFAFCTSPSLLSARRTGYSMFDWPEHNHMSPTITSSDVALAPPVPPTSIL